MASATVGTLRVLLEANASRLEAEFQRATHTLGQFDKFVQSAGEDMQRMVDRFSGQRIVTEAVKMAGAIESVGGAAVLTDKELIRVNATVDDAIAKLKKFGAEVPESISRLKTELDGLGVGAQKSGGFLSKLGPIGQALGPLLPTISVAALTTGIVKLGSAVVENADHLIDLSSKTGLSTVALQRMEAVAQQTGTTVDAFANATFNLGIRAAQGTAKFQHALAELGIEHEKFKQLKPEEQFDKAIAALEKETDVTKRNLLGKQLFGAEWAKIAPAVAEGYTQIAAAAEISSDAQIQALGRAADAWQRFKDDLLAGVTSMAGETVIAIEGIINAVNKLGALKVIDILGRASLAMAATGNFRPDQVVFALGQAFATATPDVEAGTDALNESADATKSWADKLRDARIELLDLLPAERDELDVALKMSGATQKVADHFGITIDALKVYQQQQRDATKATKEFESAAKAAESAQIAWDKEQSKFRAEMDKSIASVLAFIEKANLKTLTDPAESVKLAERWTKPIVDAQINAFNVMMAHRRTANEKQRQLVMDPLVFEMDQIIRAGEEKKRLIGQDVIGWQDAHAAINADTAAALAKVTETYKTRADEIIAKIPTIGKAFRDAFAEFPNLIKAALTGGGGLSGAFQAMTSTLGGGLTQTLFGAGGALNKLGNTMTKGVSNLFGKAFGDAFGMALPGIGSLLGPLAGKAIGWLKGLFGVSPEIKKSREELDAFQKTLRGTLSETERGGLQGWQQDIVAIKKAYLAVGKSAQEAEADAAALWDTDNPDRSRAAIERVNAALKAQQEQLEKNKQEAGELFDDLMSAADETGEQLPAHFLPYIEQMRTLGLLTDEQAEKLKGLADESKFDLKQLQEDAKALGIDFNALGPKFQSAKLGAGFEDLYLKMKRLMAAGGDVGTVLAGSADEISALVVEAKKFGTSVPEQFRPWVEELLRAGKLVDENGNKLEDLSGINFGDPIVTAMDRMIDKLNEFIDRILAVPGAFDKASQAANDAERNFDPNAPDRNRPGVPTNGGTPPGYAEGTIGTGSWFRNFGSGMMATLHGMEAVVRPHQAMDFAADTLQAHGITGTSADSRLAAAVLAALASMENTVAQMQMTFPIVMRDAVRGAI